MTEVLRKVGKSLRTDGSVLIIQPSPVNPIVEVMVDGFVEFREVTNEQNFRRYLRATADAIQKTVGERYFEIVCEATIPEVDSYHCKEYDTLDEWVEDRISFCEDIEAFSAMSERIRNLVGGRAHRVSEYWREYKVLLRKLG